MESPISHPGQPNLRHRAYAHHHHTSTPDPPRPRPTSSRESILTQVSDVHPEDPNQGPLVLSLIHQVTEWNGNCGGGGRKARRWWLYVYLINVEVLKLSLRDKSCAVEKWTLARLHRLENHGEVEISRRCGGNFETVRDGEVPDPHARVDDHHLLGGRGGRMSLCSSSCKRLAVSLSPPQAQPTA